MNRRKKRYLAGILTAALCVTVWKMPSLYAAPAIDPDRSGSLTVSIDPATEYGADLAAAEFEVDLYKVADMSATGVFKSTDDFAALKIEDIPSGEEDWEKTAADAKAIVEASENTEGQAPLQPAATLQVINGTATAENLSHGLYLVLAEEAVTAGSIYRFNPYLISVPDNLYYQTGDTKDDEWIYDVTTSLKPEQSPRYGRLEIVKTLQDYNTSLGNVTFVFQVEGKDADGNVVYSNVASTTFGAAGTKTAVLEQIPVGAELTVTEVYSGASYKLTSDEVKTGTMAADETLQVEFSNTYDDELKPGYGVTNHFSYDEENGWKWEQLTDNTQSVAE